MLRLHMTDIGGWSTQACALLGQGQAVVLVTVVRSEGSVPRGGGAKLWVTATGQFGTIGGGHLEFKALELARQMLLQGLTTPRSVQRYALGPSLGQCCGGVVWLAFERLTPADAFWCGQVAENLQQNRAVCREVDFTRPDVPVTLTSTDLPASHFNTDRASWDPATQRLRDVLSPAVLTVVVCGAGHVGRAIVNILATLPVQVLWMDPRDDIWPETLPVNVHTLQGDAADVAGCPENAFWLVLTHSHALDLELVEAVLATKTFRFLGLIGSKSKKAKFESRLLQRYSAAQVARVTCPIGSVQTRSKLPEVIAVSVVAQLLALA